MLFVSFFRSYQCPYLIGCYSAQNDCANVPCGIPEACNKEQWHERASNDFELLVICVFFGWGTPRPSGAAVVGRRDCLRKQRHAILITLWFYEWRFDVIYKNLLSNNSGNRITQHVRNTKVLVFAKYLTLIMCLLVWLFFSVKRVCYRK